MTPSTSPSLENSPLIDTAAEIAALNEAVVAALDNVDEYRRLSFVLEQRLNEVQMRIHARMQAVEALQSRVLELGGQPAKTRSLLATAFAGVLSMRQIFTRNRETDLIADAERGESFLLGCLKRSLAKLTFSAATLECFRTAFDGISKRRPPDDSTVLLYNPQTRPLTSGAEAYSFTNS